MLITDFNSKKTKVLHDIVFFKWIKDNKWNNSFNLIIPDKIFDHGGEGRLGNMYTAEAISVGQDTRYIKPGMRFIIHEYDKLEQGDPWKEDTILFCEEGVIKAIISTKETITVIAKEITDKMMNEYENY